MGEREEEEDRGVVDVGKSGEEEGEEWGEVGKGGVGREWRFSAILPPMKPNAELNYCLLPGMRASPARPPARP